MLGGTANQTRCQFSRQLALGTSPPALASFLTFSLTTSSHETRKKAAHEAYDSHDTSTG